MSYDVLNLIQKDFDNKFEAHEINFDQFHEATNIINTIELCAKNKHFEHINDLIQDKCFDEKQKNMLTTFIKSCKNEKAIEPISKPSILTQNNTSPVESIDSDFKKLFLEFKNEVIKKIENKKSNIDPDVIYHEVLNKVSEKLNSNYDSIIQIMSSNIKTSEDEIKKIHNSFNQIHQEFYNKNMELANQFSNKQNLKKIKPTYIFLLILLLITTNIFTAFAAARFSSKMAISNFSNYKITEQKAKNFDVVIKRLNSLPKKDSNFIKDKLGFIN